MAFKIGQFVKEITPTEHLASTIGLVITVEPNGAIKIEWTTVPSPNLPYGCINLEYWPVEDQHLLTVIN